MGLLKLVIEMPSVFAFNLFFFHLFIYHFVFEKKKKQMMDKYDYLIDKFNINAYN